MGLETRVETLEHEIKILKHEIQSTLLEIQEQILIHYYPSLRSEETSPPKESLATLETRRSELANGTNGSHARKRAATDRAAADPEEPAALLREVSLNEIEDSPKQGPASLTAERSAVTNRKGLRTAAEIPFSALIEWTVTSAELVGGKRTRRLLEIYTREGYLVTKAKKALVQLATLEGDVEHPRKVNVKAMLDACLRLDAVLDRETDITEALAFSEEASGGEDDRHDLHDHR